MTITVTISQNVLTFPTSVAGTTIPVTINYGLSQSQVDARIDDKAMTSPTEELETEPADANYFAIFTTSWLQLTWANLKTWLGNVFLKLDQSTPQTFINGIPLLEEDHPSFTDKHQIVDKEFVESSVALIGASFFMLDAADALLPAYKSTSLTISALPSASLDSPSIGASTDTLIGSWISPVGVTFTELLGGVYNLNIFAERLSGNRTCRLFWRFYERKVNGDLVLIATSSLSNVFTIKVRLRAFASIDTTAMAVDSRLVGSIYVNTEGGGSPTVVQISYQNDENSHWDIPVSREYLAETFAPLSHVTQASGAHPATAITFTIEEITADRVIEAADSGKHFYSTAAGDINVTINVGLTHPISIFQKGNGVVTIVAGSGVTLVGNSKTGGVGYGIAVVPETTAIIELMGGVA